MLGQDLKIKIGKRMEENKIHKKVLDYKGVGNRSIGQPRLGRRIVYGDSKAWSEELVDGGQG